MAAHGAPGADLQEVLERLLAVVRPLPPETVSAWEAAGRIAVTRLRAPVAVPRIARAAMDGVVCHDADVRGAAEGRPVTLKLTGTSVMGEPPGPGPGRSEAWTITTGAPIPRRGDRVLPLETVRTDGATIYVGGNLPRKRHIAGPGEDIQPGDVLASPGDPIPPAAAGALAACGVAVVPVYRRPRVALVATGSELVEPTAGDPPPPGCIVNSNAVTLAGELAAAGCAVDYRGILPDRPREMARAFAAMRNRYDVVLSTGGVSVGRYDLVHRTWLDLGARRYAGRVELKPGGPFFAARAGRSWAIGLSGTPVACLAAFHLLVRPVLRRLAGARFVVRPVERLALADGWPSSTDRFRALWGRLDAEHGERIVHPLADSSLGRLTLLTAADALVLLPAGTPPLAPGSRVAVLRLDRPEDRDSLRIPGSTSGPLVIGVIGASGSGKTTVITGLIKRFAARGLRVNAVKHAAHGFEIDRPTSDSARMLDAGAARVVLAGPSETTVRVAGEMTLSALLRGPARGGGPAAPDLVLVEGFGAAGHPVVHVGPPKSDADAREPWMTIPAVTALSDAALDTTIDRIAARIVTLLPPVPARR